jgi:hypothetical protein
MSTKRTKRTGKTKRAGKNTGGLSDLSPEAGRTQAVQGGAFNGFANFGDIKGESTDKDHKTWVAVTKFARA